MKLRLKILTVAILVLFVSGIINGQNDTTKIKQEVQVVKEYQPSISDAFKINDTPKIKEEVVEKPDFDYSIYSRPVFANFNIKPIQAAKITGKPSEELANGVLKLGVGNYRTPYGELFYNVLPDNKSNFGMHFKHLSSSGRVKLLNDDLVDASQSENIAELFGTKFFRKSVLEINTCYKRDAFLYYGYVGDQLSDVDKENFIPGWLEKQAFSSGTLDVRLKSDMYSRSDVKYDLGLNYQFFGTKTGQQEHLAVVSAALDKDINHSKGQLDASLTYYRADSIWNEDRNQFGYRQQIILNVQPSLLWKREQSMLQVGINSYAIVDDDADAEFNLFPKLVAQWSPVKDILTLYARSDGYLNHNFYSSIAKENLYVDPSHDVKKTNYRYSFSGGIKGLLSSKINYITSVFYSSLKDAHFYVIKSQNLFSGDQLLQIRNNRFDWYYDDMKLLNLSAEIFYRASDNFSMHGEGNYYWYDMETLDAPYNMPDFDLTFSVKYHPEKRMSFTTDVFVVGARKAINEDYITLIPNSSGTSTDRTDFNVINLDPIIDLNFGIEYLYNPNINFFAKLNNFGFQKYEQWVGYTSRSFNMILGASYTF